MSRQQWRAENILLFPSETREIATVTFGEKLKQLRLLRGYPSPLALGDKILVSYENGLLKRKVSGRQILRWERGISSPTEKNIEFLARFLGVKKSELVGDDEDSAEDSEALPAEVITAAEVFYQSKTRANLAAFLSVAKDLVDPVAADSERNVEPLRKLPTPPGNRRKPPASSSPPPKRGQRDEPRKR